MRAGMSPLDNRSQFDVVTQNLIGNNMGNMLFVYSMFRTLMTEDTEIDTILTNRAYQLEEIEKMNQEYDYFVIPLANAFRDGFIKELEYLTKIVKNLTIPCIVTGIGIQKKIDSPLNQEFLFNEPAKEFMKAVLEKSALVGVRGEITAEYLKILGFQEEKDFTVIGCPSMYTYGKQLPKPKKNNLTEESDVCINYKIDLPKILHQTIEKSKIQLPNYTIIPQSIEELRLMYAGVPYPVEKHTSVPKKYPVHIASKDYRNDKIRGFVNVPQWIQYIKESEFSFGSRIHGNIAGVLAGTPSYIFVYDGRILELARYHNIPHQTVKQMTSKTDIFELYAKTDFNSVTLGHEQRFSHFLQFLDQNGLETIYDKNGEAKKVPFEEKLGKMELEPPIRSISCVSWKEREERMNLYYTFLENKKEDYRKTVLNLRAENKELKNEINTIKKMKNHSFYKRLLRKLSC